MKSGPSVMLLECTIYLTKSNRWKSKDNQNVWNEPSKKNWWNQFHQIWSSYVVFVKPGPIEDLRKKFHEKKNRSSISWKQVLYLLATAQHDKIKIVQNGLLKDWLWKFRYSYFWCIFEFSLKMLFTCEFP